MSIPFQSICPALKQGLLIAFFCCFNLFAIAAETNVSIDLSEQEKGFLAGIDTINMCVDPDWMPYEEINEQGMHRGILADLYQLITQKIKKEIVLVKTINWLQSLEFIQQGKCDILSSDQKTRQQKEYLIYSEPFIDYPIAIATLTDKRFITDIDQIFEHRFAIVKGFSTIETLSEKYPEMIIIPVDSAKIGLAMVSAGKVFGYIDTVPTIAFQVRKLGFINLKISGVLDEKHQMSIAVRNDLVILLSILNKVISSIFEVEKHNIIDNWISVRYEQKISPKPLYSWLVPLLFVFLVLFFSYFVLTRHNKRLAKVIEALRIEKENATKDLETEQFALQQNVGFVEMISHEYRTPITVISTNLDILELKNRQKPSGIESQLVKMRDAVARLIGLVETALDREKLMLDTPLVANMSQIDFYNLVEHTLNGLRNDYPRRKVIVNSNKNKLPFQGDSKLLMLMLKNIIENAFKYSSSDQLVTIDLKQTNDFLTVDVKDKGRGIAHVDMEHIFDKYHRAANTANTAGIGLGLYISKLAVVQHGGDISVDCPPEGGTHVHIYFPLVKSEDLK